MAKSPLILAALAKDAVPQLDFVQAMPLTQGYGGHYDSAVLTATDGSHYVIRQARDESAALELDTELVVLRALSPFRSHFPFEITKQIGETRDANNQRAHVFSFVYGIQLDMGNLPGNSPLANSIANALAAIHSLPKSVVENNGLPVFTAEQIIRERTAEMDRIAQTGRVSAVLLNRWERALEDVNIWRFQPTVIHGEANLNNFLTLDETISGVLGWHSLQIGDPASDFTLVQANATDDFAYSTLLEYEALKGGDENFRARSQLYTELGLGRYLLWALAQNSEAEIADATKYLDDLVADIEAGIVGPIGPKPLGTEADLTSVPVTEFLGGPLDTPAGFVDAGQALVADEFITSPMPFADGEHDPAEVDPASANLFKPVVDSSYNHKNLFGETAPIPVVGGGSADSQPAAPSFSDDATAPIPVLSDDATAPIEVVAAEGSAEESEPKNGELF